MNRRSLSLGLAGTATLVLAIACYEEPVAIRTFPPTRTPIGTPIVVTERPSTPTPVTPVPIMTFDLTPTPAATSTPLPLTTPPPTLAPRPTSSLVGIVSTPSPGCINGWIGPLPGDAAYEEGVAILAGHMGEPGPWSVTEMRYFIGPEVPWILGNPNPVERWYIRAALVDDPNFRGRWILEKRSEDIMGVSAVAPWESIGYESPDWTGFVGEGEPQNYLGLPGQWSGIPYDFVTGEGDSGNPGLPDEVVDCLHAT